MTLLVPAQQMREKVNIIEAGLRRFQPVEIPTKHYFSPGIYAREITIPAGVTLTGKIHKYTQLNILSKGDISVLTEDGLIRVQAPFHVVSPPGTKRVAHAWSECVWTTILATEETDIDKLEKYFVVDTDEEYLEFCKNEELKCLS
jgi:hypothetical protein